MNFDFSEEQQQLRGQARRYLEDRCPPTAVRTILERTESYDRALYRELGEMAFLGAAIPEAYGDVADVAVVAARIAEGERGIGLFLVDPNGPGVSRRTIESIDPTRSQAEIVFDEAPVEALGESSDGWRLISEVMDRAAVLLAFEQLGGADQTLQGGVQSVEDDDAKTRSTPGYAK